MPELEINYLLFTVYCLLFTVKVSKLASLSRATIMRQPVCVELPTRDSPPGS